MTFKALSQGWFQARTALRTGQHAVAFWSKQHGFAEFNTWEREHFFFSLIQALYPESTEKRPRLCGRVSQGVAISPGNRRRS